MPDERYQLLFESADSTRKCNSGLKPRAFFSAAQCLLQKRCATLLGRATLQLGESDGTRNPDRRGLEL